MKRKLTLYLFLSVCIFTGTIAAQPKRGSQAVTSADAKLNNIIYDKLGTKIDSYLTRLHGFGYSGSVLVMKDGKVILRKGYGLSNRAENISNTPDTVFDIGSLTKQFTAAAILKLEAAGKLKASDPVSKFLPSAPADKANITIRQLLTHTAGMPGGVGDHYLEISREELLRRIFSRKLLFEPGSRFEYSNGGYEILAAIIEEASGEPYREFLRKNLFEPAGMRSTGFWGKAAPAVNPSLIARGYDELGEVGNPLNWSETTWYGVGSGGITSTVKDLYKWHLALQGEAILSREAKEKMFTPVMPEKTPSFKYYTTDYGYGWWIQKTQRGTTRIQHGGDSIGFGAQLDWYRDENILMIVTCNIRHDWFPTIIKASRVIPGIIFGQEYSEPPAFITGDTRILKKVSGVYQLPSGGKLIVQMNKDHLEIGADGQDATDVLREGDDNNLKLRSALSVKATAVFEGTARGDFAAMAAALPLDDDIKFWRDGWPGEMRALGEGKGVFKRVEMLGTSPGGRPRFMNTILRFVFEKGYSPYIVMWQDGYFVGSEMRSPTLSALMPIQAESKTDFVGWNIMNWGSPRPLRLSLVMKGRKVTGLNIKRDGKQWVARRIDPSPGLSASAFTAH